VIDAITGCCELSFACNSLFNLLRITFTSFYQSLLRDLIKISLWSVKLREIAFNWLRNGFWTVVKPLFVNGYYTVTNPLFVCSFSVIILPLDINPLKLAAAAHELVLILVTPDCDAIEPIENVTASEDSTWPIRTPNESIAFRIVMRLLFISVVDVLIQAGSRVGLGIGSGVGSGVVLWSTWLIYFMICLNRLLSFSVTRSHDIKSISITRSIFLIGSMWTVKRSLCFNDESFFRFFSVPRDSVAWLFG
jgi:hypothetical protein